MPASALENANRPALFGDKYDVERVLGRGGMGTVFEARHLRLGHRVAIKVLGEALRVHPELVKRFEREARAAGALSSPHAVRVFDIDQTADGTPFMVMELLDGHDLAYFVARDGARPIGLSVRWVIEACDAIAEAHRLGIIHRDIKPSNLLLCDTGSIKVLDFGIAKHVAAKEAAITLGVAPLGTPQYMSPEQVRCAKDVDTRTDIWSLGVTLYELVCGRPPFNHDVPQACLVAIVADPIPDPREFRTDLPEELAAIILCALAKDPADRFQSVDELVRALAPFADGTRESDDRIPDLSPVRWQSIEETVPPAISSAPSGCRTRLRRILDSRASHPPRGKRIRSSMALVSAAVLGLAALVATPKCVGSHIEAASTKATVGPPRVGEAVTKAATLPVAPSPSPESAPATTVEAPAVKAKTTTTPAPVATVSKPASAKSARPSRALRIVGNERLVHGGISNPGF